jgi:hypothetical protein
MTDLEAVNIFQQRSLQPRLLDTAHQFHDLQIKIRNVSGLEHLQKAPSLEMLQTLAESGRIVVYNVSIFETTLSSLRSIE